MEKKLPKSVFILLKNNIRRISVPKQSRQKYRTEKCA